MMNKENFWSLIDQAKKDCDQDTDKMPDAVKERLTALFPEDIVQFYNIYSEYMKNAHTIGLWDAARVMNKGCCSDDGFHYFKPWLIAQGKETYLNALKDPDSLAKISAAPSNGYYSLENMNYAAHDAYEELTGENIYEAGCDLTDEEITEIRDEIDFEPTINRPRKWGNILSYIPTLCEKYMPNTILQPDNMWWNKNSSWYIDHIQYLPDSEKLDWFVEFIYTQAQNKIWIDKNEENELCVSDNHLESKIELYVTNERLGNGKIKIGIGCHILSSITGDYTEFNKLKSDIDTIFKVISRFPEDGLVVSEKAYEKYLSTDEIEQAQNFDQEM